MEGYMEDNKGRLVPEAQINPIDKARDQVVKDLIARAAAVSQVVTEFRKLSMDEIKAFIDLSLKEYGVSWGGKKGNVTLLSFNGAFRVEIAVADRVAFDERLQAAKLLVDKCVNRWLEGSNPKLRILVDRAFQVDKQGNINVGRVLELRHYPVEDEEWKSAMDAIGASIIIVESKEYVRFYKRNEQGGYDQINLDFAAA